LKSFQERALIEVEKKPLENKAVGRKKGKLPPPPAAKRGRKANPPASLSLRRNSMRATRIKKS